MMGMHGESWVNHAIQEADLLLAFGMRFDDRVTGNLLTTRRTRRRFIRDRSSEINKNVRVDVALIGDLQVFSKRCSRCCRNALTPAGCGRSMRRRGRRRCATSSTCRTTAISMPRM